MEKLMNEKNFKGWGGLLQKHRNMRSTKRTSAVCDPKLRESLGRKIAMRKDPKLRLVQATGNGNNPPRKLGPEGLSLWNRVLADYNVDDTGARELLCLACESLDRACSLRIAIDKEGEFIQTRTGGLREHPGLKMELAARAFCAKMLCRLGLHVEPLRSSSGRPGYGGLGIEG
jgi:hypothetical protein